MEDVRREGKLDDDILGGVLASLKEGEHCVPHCSLSHDWVDQSSGVEVLHAQDERDRVGPAFELGRSGGRSARLGGSDRETDARAVTRLCVKYV